MGIKKSRLFFEDKKACIIFISLNVRNMKNILLKIHQLSLRNAEFLQYHTQIRAAITASPEAEEALAAPLEAYDPKLEELNIVFVRDRASAFTAQIETADHERDDLLTGFVLRCKSESYSPQPAVRDAANTLLHHIGIYGGDIQSQNINAETASLSSLLGDFAAMPALAAAILTTGAAAWIAPIAAANARVDTLYQKRNEDTATATLPYTMKEKRAEVLTEWNRLAHKIAGHYAINDGAAPWGALVGTLNVLTQKYMNLLRARRGRSEGEDDEA